MDDHHSLPADSENKKLLQLAGGIVPLCVALLTCVASAQSDKRNVEPLSARQAYEQAAKFEQAGKTEAAVTSFKRAIDIYPTFVDAYLALGQCYLNAGNRNEAARILAKLTQFAPEEVRAHLTLGRILMAENQREAAAIQFAVGVQYHPDDPRLNLELGRAYFALGNPERAATTLQKVVALDPRMWAARQILANIYRSAGQTERALEQFHLAAIQNPDESAFWTDYGKLLLALSRPQLAAEQLQRAITLDPTNVQARLEMANAQVANGKTAEAMKILESILKDAPDQSEALELLNRLRSTSRPSTSDH